MENKIQKILTDLYLLDPDLKKNEAVLIQLIRKLIEIKPEIVVDRNFVSNLRSQLLSQISQMESSGQRYNVFFSGRWSYALGSLLVIFVVLAGISYINGPATFRSEIQDVDDNGFGPLVQNKSEMARSQSGGGVGLGGGGGGGTGILPYDPKMMPPFETTRIVYQYTGDDFTQDEKTVQVLKRVVDKSAIKSISKNVSAMGLGSADLSRLSNPIITDVNISEEVDYGYNISVSFREGWLSFYQNWQKWPQLLPCFDTPSCQKANFVEESQFPGEESIVEIADNFIKKYRIDVSAYGKGVISNNWRNSFVQFPKSVETGTQLIGSDVPVIYPLLIDGKEVYEEWGGQVGIFLTVNIMTNRVTSAGQIGVQNYERSAYEAETDEKRILELAEKGGINDIYYSETPTKIITVKLGTPKTELAQMYKHNFELGIGELIYVPSLVFPVTEISDRQYLQRDNVVIPLASELFNQRLNPIQPPVQIMR